MVLDFQGNGSDHWLIYNCTSKNSMINWHIGMKEPFQTLEIDAELPDFSWYDMLLTTGYHGSFWEKLPS